MKQYIILVEENLKKYSLGKNIVHACHNCQIASRDVFISDKQRDEEWRKHITKVIVTIDTKFELLELMLKVNDLDFDYINKGIPPIASMAIQDIGKKETEKGTIICGAIGPVTDDEAKILGLHKLKLFKGELK